MKSCAHSQLHFMLCVCNQGSIIKKFKGADQLSIKHLKSGQTGEVMMLKVNEIVF